MKITATHTLSFTDAVLAMALAWRIHGTEAAIRATAHRCRDLVNAQYRPILSKLMRHENLLKWLDLMMAQP